MPVLVMPSMVKFTAKPGPVPAVLVAVKLVLTIPGVLGVPVICPLPVFRLSPAGRLLALATA